MSENINNVSILGSLIRDFRQEKKSLGVGMAVYFLFLSIVFIIVIGMVFYFHFVILYPFPFNLIITELLFSLPAIPSSFITVYLSKRNNGIYTVIISGFLVIILISIIMGLFVLLVFTSPPPANEWESFVRYMSIILIFYFYILFIFPVGLFSTFFASISSNYGNKLSMSR
ncbi:MAG: hypothetical protein ACFFC6_02315 [Promethearchaeota archaeon]